MDMTYYLNPELNKIQSPVSVKIDDVKLMFSNGKELCEYKFDKHYVVKSIWAKDNVIKIELIENKGTDISWIGEEPVSYF